MEDFTLSLTAEELDRRVSLLDIDKTPVTMELLWENASPSSVFGAQDILLNTSGFDGIEIVFQGSTTSKGSISGGSIRLLEIGTTGQMIFENSAYINQRYVNWFDNSKISFGDTREARVYGNYAERINSNSSCIPLKIYGIKGVK